MQNEQPAAEAAAGSAWLKYRYLIVILCAFTASRILF